MTEKARFRRTEHLSTRVFFGGFALANADEYQADQTLGLLLSYGINHIDTARDYGKGRWMRHHRGEFFLATKTLARTYQKAKEDIRHSLETLGVEDPKDCEQAFGPGRALEALVEAKERRLTRFLGVRRSIPSFYWRG